MRENTSQDLLKWLGILGFVLWMACPRARGAEPGYFDHTLPSNWEATDTGVFTADADNAEWWRGFGDPLLDSLIAIGRRNNYDVAVAARRIEIARAQAGQARSAYFPTFGLDAGWSRERMSGLMSDVKGPATTLSSFSGTVNMRWEIDVFGKITAQVRQAKAEVKVSAAEFAGVGLSVDAEIASTYIGLLVSRGQLAVAREHSKSQLQILNMTKTRHETGLASKLDVAQASTLYYSTIAQIPLLEASIDASVNSLAVLLGTTRDQLPAGVMTAGTIPTDMPAVGLGTPADLLRRRPDVVQAEKSIDAAAAALGIARKDYLPSLSVAASAGTQAHNIGDLFSRNSFTYTIAPTLSWTIFDGLSRRYGVAEAREQMEVAIDNYNLAILTAVEEVSDAARRYTCTQEYISTIEEVVASSAEEVKLSVDLYKEGLTAFSNVVDAMLNYLSYQNTLVSARGQAIDSLINLYKALGGGWSAGAM